MLCLRICASPVVHSADVELVLGCWLADPEWSCQGGLEQAWAIHYACHPAGQDRLRADRLGDGAGIIPPLELAANSRVGCSGSSRPLLKAGFRRVREAAALPQRPCNLQGGSFLAAQEL